MNTNTNYRRKAIPLVIVLSLFMVLALVGCSPQEVAEPIPVTFATVHFIGEAPSYVAYYNGYFEQHGLQVQLDYSAAGKVSLDKLLDGQVDIVTCADTPIVYRAFNTDEFVIIGSMVHSDKIAGVVARKDAGISEPADLVGKKIALFQGTASDFLLDTFFLANGLNVSDVELIDLKPPAQVEAIVNGEIDVMFSWQPHLLNALNQLGENGLVMPAEGMKPMNWLILARKDYAEANPEVLKRFLAAIKDANDFIAENRETAIDLHAEEIEMDRAIVDALWDDVIWELNLSEAMLINLENQARWAIDEGRVEATEMPNYLSLVYFEALEAVNSEAITIVR